MTPATEALVERLEAGARQNVGRYYGDMSGAIVSHDLLTEAAAAIRAFSVRFGDKERLAQTLYESGCLHAPPVHPWATMSEFDRDMYRDQAEKFIALSEADFFAENAKNPPLAGEG